VFGNWCCCIQGVVTDALADSLGKPSGNIDHTPVEVENIEDHEEGQSTSEREEPVKNIIQPSPGYTRRQAAKNAELRLSNYKYGPSDVINPESSPIKAPASKINPSSQPSYSPDQKPHRFQPTEAQENILYMERSKDASIPLIEKRLAIASKIGCTEHQVPVSVCLTQL